MALEKILIIEDDENHQKYAREVLGDKLVGIASSYKEFGELFEKKEIDCVLSDFYFPSDYEGTVKHSDLILSGGFLEIIRNFMVSTRLYDNPIGKVIEAIRKTGVLGDSLLEVYDKLKEDEILFKNSGFDNTVKNELERYKRYLDYQNLIDTINDETHQAPFGLSVKKRCDEKNIPCLIVTDSYHHGTDFQPFVDVAGAYIDVLDENGRKPWIQAYERLNNS